MVSVTPGIMDFCPCTGSDQQSGEIFLFHLMSVLTYLRFTKDWGRLKVSEVISLPEQATKSSGRPGHLCTWQEAPLQRPKNFTWKLNEYRKKRTVLKKDTESWPLLISLPGFKVSAAFYSFSFYPASTSRTTWNLLLSAQSRIQGSLKRQACCHPLLPHALAVI